jgi:hypothetical protein
MSSTSFGGRTLSRLEFARVPANQIKGGCFQPNSSSSMPATESTSSSLNGRPTT